VQPSSPIARKDITWVLTPFGWQHLLAHHNALGQLGWLGSSWCIDPIVQDHHGTCHHRHQRKGDEEPHEQIEQKHAQRECTRGANRYRVESFTCRDGGERTGQSASAGRGVSGQLRDPRTLLPRNLLVDLGGGARTPSLDPAVFNSPPQHRQDLDPCRGIDPPPSLTTE
jgi:hypothetical protein